MSREYQTEEEWNRTVKDTASVSFFREEEGGIVCNDVKSIKQVCRFSGCSEALS